jgi:hypothetical protein
MEGDGKGELNSRQEKSAVISIAILPTLSPQVRFGEIVGATVAHGFHHVEREALLPFPP